MKPLRIAFVGLGKMGLLHFSILNTISDAQVIAICDKSLFIRRFAKKIFKDAQFVDDVEKLSNLDLDVIYVTTPIALHYTVVKAIYLNRIARNVFVEKTLGSSYEESGELCRLAEKSGGVHLVGYQRRFAVTFKKANELLSKGTIGDITSFEAYAYSSDYLDCGSTLTASRGGVLRDLGSHLIDLALWFFGDLRVDSAKVESMTGGNSEDRAYFNVKGCNGLEGNFNVSGCMKDYRLPEVGLVIRGSKGIIRANDEKVELRLDNEKSSMWHRHDLKDNVKFLLGTPEYFREDICFIKSVLDGGNAEPSFHTALKVDYIVDQVESKASKNE